MIRIVLSALWLSYFSILGSAAAIASPRPATLVVRSYNLAGVPAGELAEAKEAATRIFSKSGLRLRWLECTLETEDAACSLQSGPAVLNLRIRSAKEIPAGSISRSTFGRAFVGATSGFPRTADVYFDRVCAVATSPKYRGELLLASVIAHELGHLLLGANSHSKNGLMAGPWDPRELLAASRGILRFSKEETAHVRRDVAARTVGRRDGEQRVGRGPELKMNHSECTHAPAPKRPASPSAASAACAGAPAHGPR